MVQADIDLIVMTYNEERNLERCLQSVQGLVKHIFVVDSGSTDRTLEIAEKYGAHIVTHEFTTQTEQFNWALDHLSVKSKWVLRLDADEYLLPELRHEIADTLPKLPSAITGLYIKRRMIFMGRWIRHGGYYPTWILRLFRYGKGRNEPIDMNEHIVLVEGKSGRLKNDFVDEDHDGLASWTIKHEEFATRQARVLARMERGYDRSWIQPSLFENQPQRKRWLTYYLYRAVPLFLRAFLYFLYRYFVRLGFLDGVQGLAFHFLQGFWYPFYIDAKIYEQRLIRENSPRYPVTGTSLRRS